MSVIRAMINEELIEGPPSHPDFVEVTGHSIIESRQLNGLRVILKRCREPLEVRSIERFRREVDALKIVGKHGNIAEMLSFEEAKHTIILRYEEGSSLNKLVDDKKKCTVNTDDCHIIWTQVCSALAFLHSRSVIHDDVKPDNIMFCTARRKAVLVDFGAALIAMPATFFNLSGTPSFAPPEYLEKKKSAKSDVWSLGITMLFAFGFITMPNGNWFLPAVLDEDHGARKEMLQWLKHIDRLRSAMEQDNALLASMLVADPESRIDASMLLDELDREQTR